MEARLFSRSDGTGQQVDLRRSVRRCLSPSSSSLDSRDVRVGLSPTRAPQPCRCSKGPKVLGKRAKRLCLRVPSSARVTT